MGLAHADEGHPFLYSSRRSGAASMDVVSAIGILVISQVTQRGNPRLCERRTGGACSSVG